MGIHCNRFLMAMEFPGGFYNQQMKLSIIQPDQWIFSEYFSFSYFMF